jgi:hypothetical protein
VWRGGGGDVGGIGYGMERDGEANAWSIWFGKTTEQMKWPTRIENSIQQGTWKHKKRVVACCRQVDNTVRLEQDNRRK